MDSCAINSYTMDGHTILYLLLQPSWSVVLHFTLLHTCKLTYKMLRPVFIKKKNTLQRFIRKWYYQTFPKMIPTCIFKNQINNNEFILCNTDSKLLAGKALFIICASIICDAIPQCMVDLFQGNRLLRRLMLHTNKWKSCGKRFIYTVKINYELPYMSTLNLRPVNSLYLPQMEDTLVCVYYD